MKWLFAGLLICLMVAPAMAGEDPYIGIVGLDCQAGFPNVKTGVCPGAVVPPLPIPDGLPWPGTADTWYFSQKHEQFLYDTDVFFCMVAPGGNCPGPGMSVLTPTGAIAVPAQNSVCWNGTAPTPANTNFSFLRYPIPPTGFSANGCEMFLAQTAANQPEVCTTTVFNPLPVPPFTGPGLPNSVTRAGNSGFYEWWIRLPKKPSGEINIVIQCGVLKPNAFTAYGFNSIEICAAETGERIGVGTCVRQEVDPGVSPVNNVALPRLTAVAYPGPFNSFAPFHLTAFKNPSSYTLAFDPVTSAMANNTNSQVLDGSTSARILLKACLDKTVVTKLPVTGQQNAFVPAETETDLEAGDIIQVRLDIPRQNTVDIYCHAQSARLAGVGEAPF